MNRRDLLRYLLATPLAAIVDYDKLLWVPGERKLFVPSQAQIDFLACDLPVTFYGIPYHRDVITGEWLGLQRRTKEQQDELNRLLNSLIENLENHKHT